ncbi:hypothetical protein N8972_01345 [Sulfurospirillum sp.]|nr:hypothetical protein [Sulfurospirillum sp.]
MQFKILSILIISFLFIGCSQKYNEYAKPTDILHEQSLTQTKKVEIKSSQATKAYITATYINQIEHELAGTNDEVERFIVSIYIPSEQRQDLYDEIFFIINGDVESCVTILQNDNPLLELIPAPNPWSRYYYVEAPREVRSKKITFSFKTFEYESRILSFPKNYL